VLGAVIETFVEDMGEVEDERAVLQVVQAEGEGGKDEGLVLSALDLGEGVVAAEVLAVLVDVEEAGDEEGGQARHAEHLC
jgi:hypothetical protein